MNPVAEPQFFVDESGVRDDETDRYGIYEWAPDYPVELARTSRDGIGLTIVTLMDERRAEAERAQVPSGAPIIAIKDRLEHRWVTGLWKRGDHV